MVNIVVKHTFWLTTILVTFRKVAKIVESLYSYSITNQNKLALMRIRTLISRMSLEGAPMKLQESHSHFKGQAS